MEAAVKGAEMEAVVKGVVTRAAAARAVAMEAVVRAEEESAAARAAAATAEVQAVEKAEVVRAAEMAAVGSEAVATVVGEMVAAPAVGRAAAARVAARVEARAAEARAAAATAQRLVGTAGERAAPDGQRQGNRQLWRQLARAPEAVAGCPVGRPRPGSTEPPGAARRALRRQMGRAGALPREHFDHAAAPVEMEVSKAARARGAKPGLVESRTPRRLADPCARGSPPGLRPGTGRPSTTASRTGTGGRERCSAHQSQQSLCRRQRRSYHQGEARR